MSNYGFCKMGSQPVTETRTYGPTHQPLTGASQSGRPNTESEITATPLSLVSSSSDLTPPASSLTCGSNGSVEVRHQYDALGRRVARAVGGSTTIFVQAGQQPIADYVAGAAPASSTYRYVYASYIDEPILRWQTSGSTAVYYHRNQKYSVTALTDASGAVLERYAYSAYGVPTIANASGTVLTASAHNNRYMYTGREWDNDIQQYHYRARMYDASLGRFCSRDPIGFEGSEWGLYEYVDSKPFGNLDPEGKMVVHPGVVVIVSAWIAATMQCAAPYYLYAQATWDCGTNDKFCHCWVSCQMSRTCTAYFAQLGGASKEARDAAARIFCRRFPDNYFCKQGSGHGTWQNSIDDLIANQQCVNWETYLTIVNVCARFWRDSCEDCCRRKSGDFR